MWSNTKTTRRWFSRSLFPLAVATICTAIWTTLGVAQTRFEEPTGTLDISTYRTVEQCWAVKNRLIDRWQKQSIIRYDTMPPGHSDRMTQWPKHIVEAVRACTERWSANTVSLQDWDLFGELFLVAGRERDFSLVLARKMSEAESQKTGVSTIDTSTSDSSTTDSATTVLTVYAKALDLYRNARPVHLREMDSLVMSLVTRPDSIVSKLSKIEALWSLRSVAELVERGSVVAIQAAMIADTLFVGLSEETRRAPWYRQAASRAAANSYFLHFRELMDSLSVGTTAYVTLVRAQNDALFAGDDPERNHPLAIGAASPRIDGDHWFPTKPVIPRPSSGKLSLIFPLSHCRGGWRPEMADAWDCVGQFAMLQRIHHQFPDVEINLISYQEGRAILTEPGSAADEAEDMRRWLLEYFHLPVTLAVNDANFVRLPDPDGRWVNTKWTLEPMLNWGCSAGGMGSLDCFRGVFLVDESGVLLGEFGTRWSWREIGESQLVSVLEAIARRKP